MISLHVKTEELIGISREELARDFSEYDLVRQIERYSIRNFMSATSGLLIGKVLDFGAGTEPYKKFVTGEYLPFHKGEELKPEWFGHISCIMCNQVLQFIPDASRLFVKFHALLKDRGHLVMTGGTNWPEVESDDYVRLTRNGVVKLLTDAGFQVILCEPRSEIVVLGHIRFSLGWNLIARKA